MYKGGGSVTITSTVVCAALGALLLFFATAQAEQITPFGDETTLSNTSEAATTVLAADLDADGDLDVVYGSRDDDTIAWLENDGLTPPVWTRRIITEDPDGSGAGVEGFADGPQSVFAADLDGDGDLDVLTASRFDDTIAWFENDGTPGGAGDWVAREIYTGAENARIAIAVDIDGDGDLDVASASNEDDEIAWHENDGSTPPGWTTHVVTEDPDGFGVGVEGVINDAWSVAAADIDGDGDLDLLSAANFALRIDWWENDGTPGGAGDWALHNIDGPVVLDGAVSVVATDVDRDGDLDVVSASQHDDTIAWWENDGTPGDADGWVQHVIAEDPDGVGPDEGIADRPAFVRTVDLDADGDVDVLSANIQSNSIIWFENASGDGSGAWPARLVAAGVEAARWVATGDLDRDGDLDVLSAAFLGDEIAWYENRSIHRGVTFADAVDIASDGGNATWELAFGDVDRDGDADVVAGNASQTNRSYLNNGTAVPWDLVAGSDITLDADESRSVALGDVDRDGDLDLVVGNASRNRLYLNNGTSDPWEVVVGGGGGDIVVLYSQLDDPTGSGQSDQAFEAPYAAYSSEGADDFLVTSPTGWDIQSVFFPGSVTVAGSSPFSLNTRFYADAGGLPGAVLCDFSGNTDFDTAGDGDLTANVDCEVPGNTLVWVSNQVRQDFNPLGQHFWGTRSSANNNPSVWRNPGNGFGSGCLDWQPANAVCGLTGEDFLFEVLGSDNGGVGGVGVDITTDEHDTQSVVLGDVDGDGDLDLVAGNLDQPDRLYSNNGTAIPWGASAGSDITLDADPTRSVALGDVDRDGDLDLVAGNASTNRLYLNNGTSNPWGGAGGGPGGVLYDQTDDVSASATDQQFEAAYSAYSSEGADDFFVSSPIGWDIESVLFPGTFTVAGATPLFLNTRFYADAGGVPGAVLCDFPGNTDFVASAGGDLTANVDCEVPGNTLVWVSNQVRLDFNPFGQHYWKTRTTANNNPFVWRNPGNGFGNGCLDWQPANAVCGFTGEDLLFQISGSEASVGGIAGVDITTDAQDTQSVALGDVDGDGDLDLIAGNWNQPNRLYLNNGTADPWTAVTGVDITADAQGTRWVELGDVDADGDLDLLTGNLDSSRLYLNNGTPDPWAGLTTGVDVSTGSQESRHVGLADVDRDGDLDYVRGSGSTSLPIALFPNVGAQYRFDGEDLALQSVYDGEHVAMVSVTVTVNARPGDAVGELARLELLFESSAGVPLTGVGADELIEELSIHRDTGSGHFDSADIPITTVDTLDLDAEGVLSVELPDDVNDLRVAAPATFFVVARTTSDASSHAPGTFRMTFLGAPRSVVEDANTDSPLRAEDTLDISSSVVTVLSPLDPDAVVDIVDAGDGITTLRERVIQANANPGEDRIRLVAGTYTLTIPGRGEDAALTGDLDITDSSGTLRIVGAGPGLTMIDCAGLDRVFDVLAGATLILEGVTVTGGDAKIGSGGDGLGGGIRIRVGANVTVSKCDISTNTADQGAGTYNGGTLTIGDSSITDNAAVADGGGIRNDGTVTSNGSTISGNTAADGGGIRNVGTATLNNSTVSGNSAIPSAAGNGSAGGIGNDGTLNLTDSTVFGNSGSTDGGVSNCDACPATTQVTNSIIAGNTATAANTDCGGTLTSNGHNLIEDTAGCTLVGDATGNIIGVEPLLGPLQNNGGPTETHALPTGSPSIDAGNCSTEFDQRGTPRGDLPVIVNGPGGNGCDIGSYEVPLADALATLEVPVRWCVVEGSPSFDFASGTVQADVNSALIVRHELASDNIFEPQAAIKLRSAANILIPDYPILSDPDPTVGELGDVVVVPKARDYEEFLQLIADCRVAWEAIDPQIVGITAVNINRFVDADGNPVEILGMGGRAEPFSKDQQMVAGRVMVVDRVHRMPPEKDPGDLIDRLFGHEAGHAAGALRHGDGFDNDGLGVQCANGILDDDDDRCEERARLDGQNLMQYRMGSRMTTEQIALARAHIQATVPDFELDVEVSGLADEVPIDEEFLNMFEFEFLNIFEFEFLNMFEFEFLNIFEFEFLNIFEFEVDEILDFEFLNIFEFGMHFIVTDPVSGDGVTTVYASVGGLPWPTPVRPPTSYFWYLNLDEDAANPTGGRPADHGFPGGGANDIGVDAIVKLDFFSHCNEVTLVCSDYALKSVYTFDGAGFVIQLGPIPAPDAIEPIKLGLLQETVDPDREEPAVGMLLSPSFPTRILLDAVPGYWPGDPVAMEVVVALPCDLTLPDGTEVDCQCTDCTVCPDYPGCPTEPVKYKVCSDGTTRCATDGDCFADDICGPKVCSDAGSSCTSNVDCTGGPTDFCTSQALLTAGSPAGTLIFAPPVLPGVAVIPPVSHPGDVVTVAAMDFPTNTGQPMTVLLGDVVIGSDPAPVFDAEGKAHIAATIPADAIYGESELTVVLEGFATTADGGVFLGLPTLEVEEIVAPIDPIQQDSAVDVQAEFADSPNETHTAEWDWGDDTVSAGTVIEPTAGAVGVVAGGHVYDAAGVYTVTLTVADSRLNTMQQTFQFVVIYDPAEGFVTGGGWIDSPPGAYAPEPGLIGRGKFGFVSKYKKGANVPTGETEFEFEVAGLLFESTEYDWLVIAGPKAMYKGSGTINGQGNYGFMLTAIDEKLTPSTDEDLFRIKIWDKDDDDTVVYDNQMGDAEDADPSTALGGGSIVIHKKN